MRAARLGVADTLDKTGAEPAACNQELIRLAEMDSRIRFRTLLTQASRANISVYPVTPDGLGVFDSPISDKDQAFALTREFRSRDQPRRRACGRLAENTDGLAIVNTNDLSNGMKRIIDDVSAYYLLGYYSTNTRNDGRYRKIEVKLKQPGIHTRARRGYFAPAENAGTAGSKGPPPGTATAAPDAGAEAAFSALTRLKATTPLYTSVVAAGDELHVVVELASSQLSDDRWGQGADVTVMAIGPQARPSMARRPGSMRADGARSFACRSAAPRLPGGECGRPSPRVPRRSRILVDVQPAAGRLLGAPVLYRGTPAATSPLATGRRCAVSPDGTRARRMDRHRLRSIGARRGSSAGTAGRWPCPSP